jgi:hypothetical protein
MAEELRAGDSVDFGVSRMSSVRVQDMQRLGYFGGGVARVPGTEEVPEAEGELVVFEAEGELVVPNQAKGVLARFVSVGPATAAKASSEGWRLCLRPNMLI